MGERPLPEGRYGRSSDRRTPQRVRIALLVAGVLVGGVLAFVGYRNLGTTPIEGKQTAYEILGNDAVKISFEVARDQPERPAVCIVRARSKDGDEVGRREVLIPPSESTVIESAVIKTSRPAITGVVFGCSYQVPEYLSSTTRPSG
ncbi:DUF4307 domain-containing protein [Crossiella sp. CA-258035]|uniref:DUF4307 domain-containing protein n=1 Tax=Crossiella sp. CA-258035 TaxID=2981138 RepID=UPI0024BCF005|nr:DUF4307 domain-containing protein [Crossiella sp. CA-258035]WHT18690.1 DUF4307 domain-containing protein [Crossiella sp. CA-258035]